MVAISLKELLAQAQKAEERGNNREASAKYAALGIYLRKKERFKDAHLFILRAVKLSPSSPRLYVQLALCEELLGNSAAVEQAMARFTKYVLKKRNSKDYRAYLEEHLQPYPRIRRFYYEQMLDLDRTDADYFVALADAHVQEGNPSLAKGTLVDALRTKTSVSRVLNRLKSVLEALHYNDGLRGIKAFEKGELSLDDLITLLLGRVHREEESREAESFRVQAEEPEKDLHSLIQDLEKDLGVPLEERVDKLTPLIREFRQRSDEVIGSDSKTRMDLASAFFEMGLYQDAREELAEISAEDPEYLQSRVMLSEILYVEESYLGALEVIQGVLRDRAASEEVLMEGKYKLSQIYHRLGDIGQAIRYATELVEEAPDYRGIRDFKSLLEKMPRK